MSAVICLSGNTSYTVSDGDGDAVVAAVRTWYQASMNIEPAFTVTDQTTGEVSIILAHVVSIKLAPPQPSDPVPAPAPAPAEAST